MKKYYLFDGTAQQGPFSLEELQAKKITAATSIWFDPMPQWKPAGEIEELKNMFNSTGTPPVHPDAVTVVAPKEEDWSKKQYYFTDATGQHGPFRLEQLNGKNITSSTPVWYDPLTEWTTAGKVAGLKDIINNTAPAPQTTAAPVIAPKEEDWSKKQYYFTDASGQHGPFKLAQLNGKNIHADTPVWYDPLTEWTTAGKVAALKDIINNTAVAPQAITEDWSKKQFYFTDATGQHGPFKLDQLNGKNIHSDTPLWYDPLPEWTTAGKVAGLKDIINNTGTAPSSVITPKEEDWSRKQYYFTDATGQHGPLKLEQLNGKNIHADTPVWYDPLPEWTTAGKVAGLKSIINNTGNVSQAVKEENWDKKLFFFTDASGQQGPFKLEQLKEKNINPETPIWYDPLTEWTTAGQVPGLKDIIKAKAL